jgi:PAS domain S-box-containing protein
MSRGRMLAVWGATLAEVCSLQAAGRAVEPAFVPGVPMESAGGWIFGFLVIVSALLWVALLKRRVRKQTELIRSEAAQSASMFERYEQLFQNANDIVYTHDLEGRLTSLNKAGEKITGFTQTEALSLNFGQLIVPEQQSFFHAWLKAALEGTSSSIHEWEIVTRDGRRVTLELNIRLLHQNGRPAEFEGIARDVTERKRQEASRMAVERKLLDVQKMESLGLMAGGIAHDFNNLLTAIMGNNSLVAMEMAGNSKVQKYLNNIEQASIRAAELCKQMLAYSGRGRFQMRRMDFNAMLREMRNVLQLSFNSKIVLEMDLADTLPAANADSAQMQQMMLNLVLNASEAIGDRPGVIRIKTGQTNVDHSIQSESHLFPDLCIGNYISVEVGDDGPGMSPEIQARIFDPFFSTKFTGRGLGLAAVLGIVRGHNGVVTVKSAPGRGSVFTILIPALTASAQEIEEKKPVPAEWIGKGTILVVDDEEAVSTVTCSLLESYGFNIWRASDGVQGVELFRAHSAEIDVVLLDYIMPRMNGEEAFNEIKRLRKDVSVFLMSGYGEQEAVERFAGKGLTGFIQKPFKSNELREKMRDHFHPPAMVRQQGLLF